MGDEGDERERRRATVAPVTARNPYPKVSATVTGDRGSIPRRDLRRRDFRAVADGVSRTVAVHELAGHELEVR
jgi:hypothetical protein